MAFPWLTVWCFSVYELGGKRWRCEVGLSYDLCIREYNLDESWRVCTKLGYLPVEQQSPIFLLRV